MPPRLTCLRPRLASNTTPRRVEPEHDNSDRRLRGTTLANIRERHLRERPLCVTCNANGRTKIATQLDHVVPLHLGGIDSRDPFENRQGLCDDCHAEKTAREQRERFGLG